MRSCCCSQILSVRPPPVRSSVSSQRKRSSSSPHCLPTAPREKFRLRIGVFRSGNTLKASSISCSSIKSSIKAMYDLRESKDSPDLLREENSSIPNPDMITVESSSSSVPSSVVVPRSGIYGSTVLDSFRGKSGSVSFCGLTHQIVEERQLVSSPFKEDTGSLTWALAPLTLISSLLIPQFFLGNAIQSLLDDVILKEIILSFSSEFIFYAGLAAFLSITDHVQRPYLEFSSKRWSLITGLRGYLSSAFFITGFKVFTPLLTAYIFWPVIGLPTLVAIAPFLLGCATQLAFELHLNKRGSSCWPLLPIIFEIYRLYQLTKGAHFIEMLMFTMRGSAMTGVIKERTGALLAMLAVFQILGVVCLWSLISFLLRLFPSRPVAENY